MGRGRGVMRRSGSCNGMEFIRIGIRMGVCWLVYRMALVCIIGPDWTDMRQLAIVYNSCP
jgi:hypothetical protein